MAYNVDPQTHIGPWKWAGVALELNALPLPFVSYGLARKKNMGSDFFNRQLRRTQGRAITVRSPGVLTCQFSTSSAQCHAVWWRLVVNIPVISVVIHFYRGETTSCTSLSKQYFRNAAHSILITYTMTINLIPSIILIIMTCIAPLSILQIHYRSWAWIEAGTCTDTQ